MSEYGLPRTCSRSSFFLVLGFRLVHVTTLLVFQKCTGFPVLVYPHLHWTRLLDGDLNDQFPDLKESWVKVDELEEELVDKPGTTIGKKFSVLHCIRIPFLMRCGF